MRWYKCSADCLELYPVREMKCGRVSDTDVGIV